MVNTKLHEDPRIGCVESQVADTKSANIFCNSKLHPFKLRSYISLQLGLCPKPRDFVRHQAVFD